MNDNNNNNDDNGQQQLLRRLPQYALKRRRRRRNHPNMNKKKKKKTTKQNQEQDQYAPKFSIGTKISITDSVLYRHYDHKIDIRLDGTIEGYERVHNNTATADDDDDDDDDDDVDDKYEWNYIVRFIDHEHLFEEQDQGQEESEDEDEDDSDDDDEIEEENGNGNENEEGDVDENDEKARKDRAAQSLQSAVARAEVYNMIAGADLEEGHPLPSSSSSENDATSTSFLKVMPEQDIADSLSRDDVSYIIDTYFGRNLREILQVRYTSGGGNGNSSSSSSTVLREYRHYLSNPIPAMNWTVFFQEVKMCPNIARARFPLYDSTGETIGDFTVLAMALIVLLVSDRQDARSVTIVAQLLEVYPKGIQQGIYHNRNRQLAGGSKYLGILQFIMEFDTHEDHYQRYQRERLRLCLCQQDDDGNDTNEHENKKEGTDDDPQQPLLVVVPDYFATLIHPDILKLFITSSVNARYGQYLSTEFCPSAHNTMPLHRMMYSSWVTHRIPPPPRRTKRQHLTTRHDTFIHSIDDWLSRSCTCNKKRVPVNPFLIDDTILSPQVKMILQNNWQAVGQNWVAKYCPYRVMTDDVTNNFKISG